MKAELAAPFALSGLDISVGLSALLGWGEYHTQRRAGFQSACTGLCSGGAFSPFCPFRADKTRAFKGGNACPFCLFKSVQVRFCLLPQAILSPAYAENRASGMIS